MIFSDSPRSQEMVAKVQAFMNEHVHPNVKTYHAQQSAMTDKWQPVPIVEELKKKAKAQGLWNMFLPHSERGAGLTNLEYAPVVEVMGRVHWASEVFNCSAPDTGNMETLERYGSEEQKKQWLVPLLEGEIRSCFSMTEPEVASSDATNIQTRIVRDGDHYVINGHKWFSSGVGDPRCKLLIVMGKTDPDNPNKHKQQSMILVPIAAPGIKILRLLPNSGYLDEPHGHGEVVYENVRVPVTSMLLGEGRGFEIAQGRLGPGRIHHCMRLIGVAEDALEKMCRRALSRRAFGKLLSEHGVTLERIANARIMIDMNRLLTLRAAHAMDVKGNKAARKEIAMVKVAAANMACQVIDWAMQLHGSAGVTDDFGLAYSYSRARSVRFADGPDEVHREAVAKMELKQYMEPRKA